MSDTITSPGRDQTGVPDFGFEQIAGERLALPPDLFDAATPLGQATPFENAFPLIVGRRTDGAVVVIDGRKRLLRGKRAGIETFPCGVLKASLDQTRIGLLRITLNKGRALHVREKLCFVRWLDIHIDRQRCAAIGHDIGIADSELQVLRLLSSAGDDTAGAILSGLVHFQCAGDFLLLTKAQQKAFLETFFILQLSVQSQREFLQWLPEIASAESVTLEQILQRDPLQQILRNPATNNPQKIQHVRDLLHSWRFPRFHSALRDWESLARSINPDQKNVSFECSQSFEKDLLGIRIQIPNAEKASKIFEALGRVPRSTWERLIYPCRDSRTE